MEDSQRSWFPLCYDHIVLSLLQSVVNHSSWFINIIQIMFYLGHDLPHSYSVGREVGMGS